MHHIIIQKSVAATFFPKSTLLRKWAKHVLNKQTKSTELTIRIVDHEEMATLNKTYRHKEGPTNILSFPFSMPDNIQLPTPILGDLVICAEVVNREAKEQNKTKDAHWAHMIVHGILHLFGYDHEKAQDADVMEKLEIEILQTLGFNNPYIHGDDHVHD